MTGKGRKPIKDLCMSRLLLWSVVDPLESLWETESRTGLRVEPSQESFAEWKS